MIASSLADFSFGVTMEKQDAERIDDSSINESRNRKRGKRGFMLVLLRGSTIFFADEEAAVVRRNPRISSRLASRRTRETVDPTGDRDAHIWV